MCLCHQLSVLYWNSHLLSCCSLVCPLLRAVCSCLSAVPGLDPAGLEPGSTSALTGAAELPLPPAAAPSPALPGQWSHQLPVCTRMTFPCVNSKAPSYPRNVTLAAVQLGTAIAWVPASQLQLPPSQSIWGASALGGPVPSACQAVTPTSLRGCRSPDLATGSTSHQCGSSYGAGSLNIHLAYGLINSFTWKSGEKLALAFDNEGGWVVLDVQESGVQRAEQLSGGSGAAVTLGRGLGSTPRAVGVFVRVSAMG